MNKRKLILSFFIIAVFFIPFNASNQTNMGLRLNPNQKSTSTQTRTDQWIIDLQANFGNGHWFYQNLNSNDRLLIREAIDYAMPRSSIINNIMDGFGVPLATYATPSMGTFYNPNVHPFSYNLATASSLLSQVFGYTYATDNPNTPYNESAPYFPLNLTVPTSNPTRVQWATQITGILNSIGIKTTLAQETFTQALNQIYQQSSSVVLGGYDGIFIAWSSSFMPDDGSQWFGSTHIPQNNYQNVTNSTIEDLITQEHYEPYSPLQRQTNYLNMQNYVENQMLKDILFLYRNPYLYSHNLKGFNQFFASLGTLPFQNITIPGQIAMRLGLPGMYNDFMPLLNQYDVYGQYYTRNLWLGGLLGFSTIPNDNAQLNYQAYPNLAYGNYTVTQNGMFYNFTLRPHVYWADGSELTAQDVNFTYHQILTPLRNSPDYSLLTPYMNNASIIVYDKYHIGFQLTNWADEFPFIDKLFTETIVPQSTYGAISDWKINAVDTGTGLTESLYNSNGPYRLNYVSSTSGLANYSVNSLFNSSVYSFPEIGGPVSETYAQYVSKVPGFDTTPSMVGVAIILESTPNTAINDLKTGTINYVDTGFDFTSLYSSYIYPNVMAGYFDAYNATSGASFQELGLSQVSPIWGYSAQDVSSPTSTTTGPSTSPSGSSTTATNTGNPTGPQSNSGTGSNPSSSINTSDWGIFGSGSIFVLVGFVAPYIVYYFRKKSLRK